MHKERFDPVLRLDTTHRRDLAHDVAMKDHQDLMIWAIKDFYFSNLVRECRVILKGFIERVFAASFAYENTPLWI